MSDPRQSGPGPVPKAKIDEGEITNFDQKTGDSSRGMLVVVLVVAALMLLGIFFLSEPKTSQETNQASQQK